jgi:hypothetical protein
MLGGFDASFLEEPVMLLAFVLLGRALEARAKVCVCVCACMYVFCMWVCVACVCVCVPMHVSCVL